MGENGAYNHNIWGAHKITSWVGDPFWAVHTDIVCFGRKLVHTIQGSCEKDPHTLVEAACTVQKAYSSPSIFEGEHEFWGGKGDSII